MGHLNLLLTCVVTVMAGYLGTYSSYIGAERPAVIAGL
jgi:hypothetical protein